VNAEEFKAKTGQEPENDDLERVNCDKVGQVGHFMCGWCLHCDRPKFMCWCVLKIVPGGVVRRDIREEVKKDGEQEGKDEGSSS
jgi:hypothetical protein